ncbi:Protein TRANSPARENT TESTA 12 [Triticum urartu]|uniref:Protein TRANSPARENT TESTA 12 n=1 Tax=Triticum urartu TaxID=4572 RepID=M7Z8I7_TRIUA|nr:Protein TRANSPARENT TESTA 12 [Triticum urartu]
MGKMVLLGKCWQESKLLWHIAFPAILTAVFQFSIGSVTVGFAGHIGEGNLVWHLASPAILTAVFQFSINFVTVGFVGHIGVVELAAVTVAQNVIEGFAYGVLTSFGS